MAREWLCTFCGTWVRVESDTTHGFDLLREIRDEHRNASPDCESDGPLYLPTPPLPVDQRAAYLESYLKPQVGMAEEKAASRVLDRTFLAVLKNDLVWLDCQLATDAEAVRISQEIEILNDRVSKLKAE